MRRARSIAGFHSDGFAVNSGKAAMRILAIETSCDETAAAVVEKRRQIARVRSNIVASQIKLHAKTGGVVPEVAAREHIKPIIPTVQQALRQARMSLRHIDAIAVTQGPGLHVALSVGVETAKALSYATGKPLFPVNHLLGHIAANWNGRRPKFPALALVVSGGHTELVLMNDPQNIKLLGAARDDAAGEAFDKVAQLLNIGYPGGPSISALARTGNPRAFDLPRPMLEAQSLDFSFSGLKTAVRYIVGGIPGHATKSYKLKAKNSLNDLCASFQAAVVEVLVSKTVRAAQQFKPREVLLAGGVAANRQLRKQIKSTIFNLSWRPSFSMPPLGLCTDNAAMIGLAAAYFTTKIKQNLWKTLDIAPVLTL